MTSILSKTYAVRGKQAARIEQWTRLIIFAHSEATPHICSALFCAVFHFVHLVSFVSITRALQLRLVSAFLRERGEQSMFVQPLVIPFVSLLAGCFAARNFELFWEGFMNMLAVKLNIYTGPPSHASHWAAGQEGRRYLRSSKTELVSGVGLAGPASSPSDCGRQARASKRASKQASKTSDNIYKHIMECVQSPACMSPLTS